MRAREHVIVRRQAAECDPLAVPPYVLELAQLRDVDQRRRRLDAPLQLDQEVGASSDDAGTPAFGRKHLERLGYAHWADHAIPHSPAEIR